MGIDQGIEIMEIFSTTITVHQCGIWMFCHHDCCCPQTAWISVCLPWECMVLLKLITLLQLVGREGWTIVLMCLMCKSMPFSTRKNKDEIQSRVPQWEDVFIKNESLC